MQAATEELVETEMESQGRIGDWEDDGDDEKEVVRDRLPIKTPDGSIILRPPVSSLNVCFVSCF